MESNKEKELERKELTEEQKERMRKSREKALELQKRKREEREREAAPAGAESPKQGQKQEKGNTKEPQWKRLRPLPASDKEPQQATTTTLELEDFEVQASPFVTKKEAMKVYCLPEGTLNVCKFVEKENPRNKGWTAMKLFDRTEIRDRARERWGGLEGLQKERKRREEKQFKNDWEKTKNIFSNN